MKTAESLAPGPLEPVHVIIDVCSLEEEQSKEFPSVRLCYATLLEAIAQGRPWRSTAVDSHSARRQEAHADLGELGVLVLRNGWSGFDVRQKEVDVELALQMDEASRTSPTETIILVSGDRDFLPAVERARRRGTRVEIAGFSASTSKGLQRSATRFHVLDSLRMWVNRFPAATAPPTAEILDAAEAAA